MIKQRQAAIVITYNLLIHLIKSLNKPIRFSFAHNIRLADLIQHLAVIKAINVLDICSWIYQCLKEGFVWFAMTV